MQNDQKYLSIAKSFPFPFKLLNCLPFTSVQLSLFIEWDTVVCFKSLLQIGFQHLRMLNTLTYSLFTDFTQLNLIALHSRTDTHTRIHMYTHTYARVLRLLVPRIAAFIWCPKQTRRQGGQITAGALCCHCRCSCCCCCHSWCQCCHLVVQSGKKIVEQGADNNMAAQTVANVAFACMARRSQWPRLPILPLSHAQLVAQVNAAAI